MKSIKFFPQLYSILASVMIGILVINFSCKKDDNQLDDDQPYIEDPLLRWLENPKDKKPLDREVDKMKLLFSDSHVPDAPSIDEIKENIIRIYGSPNHPITQGEDLLKMWYNFVVDKMDIYLGENAALAPAQMKTLYENLTADQGYMGHFNEKVDAVAVLLGAQFKALMQKDIQSDKTAMGRMFGIDVDNLVYDSSLIEYRDYSAIPNYKIKILEENRINDIGLRAHISSNPIDKIICVSIQKAGGEPGSLPIYPIVSTGLGPRFGLIMSEVLQLDTRGTNNRPYGKVLVDFFCTISSSLIRQAEIEANQILLNLSNDDLYWTQTTSDRYWNLHEVAILASGNNVFGLSANDAAITSDKAIIPGGVVNCCTVNEPPSNSVFVKYADAYDVISSTRYDPNSTESSGLFPFPDQNAIFKYLTGMELTQQTKFNKELAKKIGDATSYKKVATYEFFKDRFEFMFVKLPE